jgi:hypothetical protein
VKFAETRPGDAPLDLKFGDDYVFFDLTDLETAGGVVCCGTGTAEDFQRSDVAGKWALIWEGSENSQGFAANLEKSKAIGVLTAPKPDSKRAARNLGRLASRLRKGTVEYTGEGNAGRAERGVPRVALTAAGRDKLFGFADAAAPNAGDDLKVVVTETRKVAPDSGITCEDVCGFWPGLIRAVKQVILCSLRPSAPPRVGTIYNGADDTVRARAGSRWPSAAATGAARSS